MPAVQTRRKRKVGQQLAALRKRAGLTVEDAAGMLHRKQSELSKAENGYNLLTFAELRLLLVTYGASDQEITDMETWWHDAKQDSRRLQGTSAMPPTFRTFLRAEADADYVQTIDRIAIPGLLQTRAYADAILSAGRHLTNTRVDADKRETARAARQQLLLRPDPLRLHALIDEAAIRRIVGGPKTMKEQLSHVLTMAKRSNVEVQIVPESAGAYGAMSGPMQILGFDDPAEPATVYVEYEGGGAWFDNKEDVQKYSEMFRSALDLALSAAQSEVLIQDRLNE